MPPGHSPPSMSGMSPQELHWSPQLEAVCELFTIQKCSSTVANHFFRDWWPADMSFGPRLVSCYVEGECTYPGTAIPPGGNSVAPCIDSLSLSATLPGCHPSVA